MTGPIASRGASTLRLVVRRAVSDRVVTGPAWLLVLAATTLLAASVLHGDVARRDGLSQTLRGIPAAGLAVIVRAGLDPAAAERDLDRVTDLLTAALDGSDPAISSLLRSDSYATPGQEVVRELTRFADVEGIAGGAGLVAGQWPEPGADPLEVVVTAPAAGAMGLAPDSVFTVTRRLDDRTLVVKVTGIVQLDDPADPRWLSEPLLVSGAEDGASFRTTGPLLAARADVLERTVAGSVDASWVGMPNPAVIEPDALGPLAGRVLALDAAVDDVLAGGDAVVETSLPAELARVGTSLLAGGSGILLLNAQLAILAAYGLVLIAGLLLDERRAETALFRSRGADGLHLARWSLTEGVLLVASAAVLGLALAMVLVAAAPRLGILGDATTPLPRIDGAAILVTAVAAGAALVGFLLPTVASLGPLASARRAIGRQGPRGLAQRAGLDLALLAFAALALWQLRQYGAPITRDLRGTLGVDPLLVMAPAIALLAGAVLALRIVPLAAVLAERLVERARGLLLPLGARQLARRPGRSSRIALLLVIASAINLFGAAYAATWEASQGDQVDQDVGADLHIGINDARAEAWAVDGTLASVPGIDALTPVRDEAFDLGSAGRGTLLGVRAEDGDVIRARADRAAVPLPELFAGLVDARPALGGLPLPADAAAVRVRVRTVLESRITDEQPVPVDPAWLGASASVVIRDAGGLIARLTSTRAPVDAETRELVVPLQATLADGSVAVMRGPLELLAVEVLLQLPDATAAFGEVAVLGLATSALAAAPADDPSWVALGSPPDAGWTATRQALDADPVVVPVSGAGRVPIPADRAVTGPAPVRFALRAPGLGSVAPLAVPALADPGLLAALAAQPGDVVTVSEQFSDPRVLTLTGTLLGMPTIPPDRPFAVLDLPTLALSDFLAHGRTTRADAWWAQVTEAAPGGADSEDGRDTVDATISAIAALPFAAEVTSRAVLLEERLADPVTRAVLTTLGLGAIAALVFAAIGFLVTAVVGTRERLPELAVLRALGVTRGRLAGWLTLEQALLLAVGVLLGAGLGTVLAWVVLPTVTLAPTATAVHPPAIVVVPWDRVAGMVAAAGLLLVAAGVLLARMVRHGDVPAVLRVGDG